MSSLDLPLSSFVEEEVEEIFHQMTFDHFWIVVWRMIHPDIVVLESVTSDFVEDSFEEEVFYYSFDAVDVLYPVYIDQNWRKKKKDPVVLILMMWKRRICSSMERLISFVVHS